MTEIFAQFVAEVRSDLINEIEAVYGRAFADPRLEIANFAVGVGQAEWRHVAPIDLPNPIRRLAN